MDGLSRRRFLQAGGALAAARALEVRGIAPTSPAEIGGLQPAVPLPPGPSLTTVLRRREDQVRLQFQFWNLRLDTTDQGSPRLVRKSAGVDTFVVVEFLPQHVMEQAFYETSAVAAPFPDPPSEPPPAGSDPLIAAPVGSRVSAGSRLAFRIPAAVTSIPYTPEGLLAWEAWTPSVVPTARPSEAIQPIIRGQRMPAIAAPSATQTSIELPWWLLISPHVQTGWAHVKDAVTHDGRTELWHTRLAGRAPGSPLDEADESRKTVRAVWARDPGFADYLDHVADSAPIDGEDLAGHPIGLPFRTSLSPRDRYDLVVSTSDWTARPGQIADPGYLPLPAQVEHLMLSSMGAWVDLHGEWRATPGTHSSGTSLQSWRHIASMGRDQYVRVVRSGFLFPFRHGASLIKVTERKFRTVGTGSGRRRMAYAFQRYFIVVRQRDSIFGGPFHPKGGRAFPFTRMRATTLITPTLSPPVGIKNLGNTKAFVVKVNGAPFLFHMVATDRAQRAVDLAVPVVFVDGEIAAHAEGPMETLRDWYNTLGVLDPVRVVQVKGQKVAPAAPADPATPGDTDLEVHRLTLGAAAPAATDAQLDAAMQPGYFPTMAEAEIRLAAAEVAIGDALPGGLPVVVLDNMWVNGGFAATKGEIFARLKDTGNPKLLDFGGTAKGDRGGGVITPSLGITALSRRAGIVGGDPDLFQSGTFDPAEFFGGLNATLLGDLTLAQVIGKVDPADFSLSDPAKAAKLFRLRTRETPTAVITELVWRPQLHDVGSVFIAQLSDVEPATLELTATITTPKNAPGSATSVVVGDLQRFVVSLLPGAPFLAVRFDRLRFRSETGRQTDVDVDIREVVFDGPLKFINDLRDYLDFGAGGFSIDLQPTQLKAGFELPLPSISIGVFSLQSLTFAAGTTIPFTGKPIRFRFGFNTLDNPFLISVMIFGGGGFFELGIGPDGVETFQASLEFGIVGALDFGVASGSVSVTAGIYLAIGVENPPTNPDGEAELTGFLKIKGEVEVLGLITLGIMMKASFTYITGIDKAVVRAEIVVEIDVVLYSGTAEIEYEKRFGGSSDPTFGQSLSGSQWVDYTAAFAAIGA